MTAVFSLGCWLVVGYAALHLLESVAYGQRPAAIRARTHQPRRRG